MLARALLTGIKREIIWKPSKFFSSEKTPQQAGINSMHVVQMYLVHFPKTPCLGIWPSADRWPQSLGALHLWPPTAHPDTMNQKLKYSFRNFMIKWAKNLFLLISKYFCCSFTMAVWTCQGLKIFDILFKLQTQWKEKSSLQTASVSFLIKFVEMKTISKYYFIFFFKMKAG